MIEITRVSATDIPAIEAIAHACSLATWTGSDYMNELSRSDSLFFKAGCDSGSCLGFILARIIPAVRAENGEDAEIYNIGVMPDKQGTGIGTMLMNAVRDECRNRSVRVVWLEVRRGNSQGISFYSKHNFDVVAVRRSFYRDPVEDAIVMRSKLYNS